MDLFYRNLKRIGIGMVLVSVFNLVYELSVRQMLTEMDSPYIQYFPVVWGIWAKNLTGLLAGGVGLYYYRKRRQYFTGMLIVMFLCLAEAAVIVLSMTDSLGKKVNGLIDLTMLTMIVLAYTFTQTDRERFQWKRVSERRPAVLDLLLQKPGDFFNTIQAGPQMAINGEYASAVSRFLASAGPVPLEINLLCGSPVSEPMRATMREVYGMYYEMEEKRIGKELEKKYHRINLLFFVSLFAISLLRQMTLADSEMIIWEIIGNFSAFGLWQIGYIHFERNDGYDELLLVQCAKYAKINFLERNEGGN